VQLSSSVEPREFELRAVTAFYQIASLGGNHSEQKGFCSAFPGIITHEYSNAG
jgi:hypothetical protein